MPDLSLVLAVLVAAVSSTAAIALRLTSRALAPAALLEHAAGEDSAAARAAVRSASRRGFIASAVAVTALVLVAVVSNTWFREAVGDVVFAAPLVAGAIGVGVYALLHVRRLPGSAAGQASLVARRASGFAPVRSFVTMALIVAALLGSAILAALVTPVIATFSGASAVLLVLLTALVVAVEIGALRQIAVRPALPPALAELDLVIRQIGTRFVLLLSSGALLATAALIALQSGGWLVDNAAVLPEVGENGTVAGAIVLIVGALMGVGAIAAVVAAVTTTVRHLRSAGRMAACPVSVTA